MAFGISPITIFDAPAFLRASFAASMVVSSSGLSSLSTNSWSFLTSPSNWSVFSCISLTTTLYASTASLCGLKYPKYAPRLPAITAITTTTATIINFVFFFINFYSFVLFWFSVPILIRFQLIATTPLLSQFRNWLTSLYSLSYISSLAFAIICSSVKIPSARKRIRSAEATFHDKYNDNHYNNQYSGSTAKQHTALFLLFLFFLFLWAIRSDSLRYRPGCRCSPERGDW